MSCSRLSFQNSLQNRDPRVRCTSFPGTGNWALTKFVLRPLRSSRKTLAVCLSITQTDPSRTAQTADHPRRTPSGRARTSMRERHLLQRNASQHHTSTVPILFWPKRLRTRQTQAPPCQSSPPFPSTDKYEQGTRSGSEGSFAATAPRDSSSLPCGSCHQQATPPSMCEVNYSQAADIKQLWKLRDLYLFSSVFSSAKGSVTT